MSVLKLDFLKLFRGYQQSSSLWWIVTSFIMGLSCNFHFPPLIKTVTMFYILYPLFTFYILLSHLHLNVTLVNYSFTTLENWLQMGYMYLYFVNRCIIIITLVELCCMYGRSQSSQETYDVLINIKCKYLHKLHFTFTPLET